MEIVLFVIGGIIFLIFAFRRQGKNTRGSEPRINETPKRRERVVPPSSPTLDQVADRPPPFDAKSAEPERSQNIIKGAAYVIDGDSLVIKKTQVRLFGVDAPELNHPYGKKAKWALLALCKGQSVRAEITDTDAHGRTVAKCYLPDGTDLSAEMVKIGLAIDWPKFSGGCYKSLETPDARKKMWLADARQKGRMHVWRKYEAREASTATK